MLLAAIILAYMFLSGHAAPQIYQTTPVPILKQINRHNDDGSYSYGFEAADGTFKIETKYATGEVFGKYGYIGDDGKVRVVEYGASKRGFEPKGSDINVAPPTLSNSINDIGADYDDGEYREDPSIYEKEFASRPNAVASTVGSARQQRIQAPQALFPVRQQLDFQSHRFTTPQLHGRSQAQAQVRSQAHSQPLVQSRAYPAFQPRPVRISYDPSIFNGHPATNIDVNTGSFTVSYTS